MDQQWNQPGYRPGNSYYGQGQGFQRPYAPPNAPPMAQPMAQQNCP